MTENEEKAEATAREIYELVRVDREAAGGFGGAEWEDVSAFRRADWICIARWHLERAERSSEAARDYVLLVDGIERLVPGSDDVSTLDTVRQLVADLRACGEALAHADEWLDELGCDCGVDEPGTCAFCEVRTALARPGVERVMGEAK